MVALWTRNQALKSGCCFRVGCLGQENKRLVISVPLLITVTKTSFEGTGGLDEVENNKYHISTNMMPMLK